MWAVLPLLKLPFLLLSNDAEGARRQGMKVRLWDFLFYLTFGIVITQSVRIAGVLVARPFLRGREVVA